MNRRAFMASGMSLLGVLAGCTSDSDESGGSDRSTSQATETQTETPDRTETNRPTQTEAPTTASSPDFQVRVSYDGEWSGTIGGDGSSRSVDGSGTETFDVQGDPFIVSANAQKRDEGTGTLTVQILKNGEVIAQRTTSARYGVAQVTSEDGIQTASSGNSGSSSQSTFEVRIQYSGEWTGSIGQGGSVKSVDGSGTETFSIDGEPTIISANAQKQDDSSNELTVQVLKDGEVVKETSTSAEYGVAQVSYSNF